MNAIAKAHDIPAVDLVPVDQAAAIIQVIERAATNPDVDIDKMERLLEMHERVVSRNGRVAYFAALSEMQPNLPVISRKGVISVPAKDGKTGHETPYALWEDVNEAIRPLLAAHGFALSFRVKKEADRVEVTGVLSHRQGHAEETMLSLPMDTTGSKNNVQAIGSSVSYGKRYTAFALLNITSRGEDDDGKAAGAPGLSGAGGKALDQIAQLSDMTACSEWHAEHAEGLKAILTPRDLSTVERAFAAKRRELRGAAQ